MLTPHSRSRDQLAQIAWAVQAPGGRIWMQALGNALDARIHSIVENVEPLSSRQIYSNGVVRGVLEVPGGTSRMFGIAVGDRVAHPIFRATK